MQLERARSGRRARTTGLLLVVAVIALVLVPLNDGYQQGVAEAGAQEQRPVLLDVALVNEDVGAEADGEPVNLGRSFVTQVESDESARWHVVSRGVAESGLAAGGYQLLVVIPTDFSGTVVGLDQAEPEPATVTYQVNGGGSARVQTLATAKGDQIVEHLNEQVVDLYLASILGNLSRAQENVRLLVDVEAASNRVFADELDPVVRGLDVDLGLAAQRTEDALSGAGGLTEATDGLAGAADLTVRDQTDHAARLEELLAARQTGALTQAALLAELLALDGQLLSEGVQQLYDDLVRTGDSLTAQLEPGTGTGNHADHLTALREVTDGADAAVRARSDALAALDDAAVLSAYRDAAYAATDANGDGVVTLAELAVYARDGDGSPVGSAGVEALLRRATEEQIALLPYRTRAELDGARARGDLAGAGGQLAGLGDEIADDLAVVTGWDGYADVAVDPGAGTVAAGVTEALRTLVAAEAALVDPSGASAPASPGDPAAQAASAALVADLSAAAARYGAEVARVAQAYHDAARSVTLVQECADACGAVPELDVSAAVDGIVIASATQAVAVERAWLVQAVALAAQVRTTVDEVAGSYQELVATSQDLTAAIRGQLDQLATVRTSMAGILDREGLVAGSTAASDTLAGSIAQQARTLLAESGALAGTTRSVLVQADGVRSTVRGLGEDVGELVQGSTALVAQSGDLGERLTDETAQAEQFSTSFAGVLANSHRSGLLNERLMTFLVNPVEAGAREPVEQIDVARPFSWVLLAFALCLGAVCALASITGRRQEASAFTGQATAWLGSNLRALGPVTVVAVLLGTGLAWAAAVDLAVPRETQLRWGVCVVLVCVELCLVLHALVRQWRVAGVVLSVLLLIGYVLVTDAVGAGAGPGLPAVVARLDPLCRAERAMSAVLGSDPSGFALCGPLLLGIAAGVAVNLLVVRIDLRAVVRAVRRTEQAEAHA